MSDVLYEDDYLRITKKDESHNQSEIELGEIHGVNTKLLGFTEVTDDDGKLLLAYKIREDKPLALYYVWPGGEEVFRDFEEAISEEFPDHQVLDIKLYLEHHAKIEKTYRVDENVSRRQIE